MLGKRKMIGAPGGSGLMPAIGSNSGIGGASSCVLFLSEVPPNTSELELKRTFQEFGKLERIVAMPAKRQALVEFVSLSSAEAAVAALQSVCPVVLANGAQLTFSFSNRPRIELPPESCMSPSPQACLLLTVYNVRIEFNCQAVRQMCRPYGLLDRCLIVRQQDGLIRAVLQFDKLEDAVLTKPNLNGASMYSGCNSMRCEYAKHSAFEYFGSRDTVLDEFSYESEMSGAGGKRPRVQGQMMIGESQSPMAPVTPGGLLMQKQKQQQQHPTMMMQAMQTPGMPQQHQHQMQMQQLPQAVSPHNVIVVRNLSPQVNCDRLFNILVLYGNVVRVKFVTTREGFALVQMLDPQSAQQVVQHFHGQCVLGSNVKVSHSDQGALKKGASNFTLSDGTPADKSYDNVRLNRFMNPESAARNAAILGRTGKVLYYWGCPDDTTENALKEVLKLAGASEPESVNRQGEKGSTGWITFANVNDATDAICLANHTAIGETAKLKLSYAVNKK